MASEKITAMIPIKEYEDEFNQYVGNLDDSLQKRERYITNIEYLDTSKCGSFESMFYGSRFIELDVSNFNVSNVASFDSMFQECRGLRTIYSNNTSPWESNQFGYTSENMFDGCTSLQYYRRDRLDISVAFAGRDGYFTLKQD